MSVELESKRRIANLIASANEATGKEDADLTAAVGSLIAGFGQGSGENPLDYATNPGRYTNTKSLTDLVLNFGAKTHVDAPLSIDNGAFAYSDFETITIGVGRTAYFNGSNCFGWFANARTVKKIDLSGIVPLVPPSLNTMFSHCLELVEILGEIDCTRCVSSNTISRPFNYVEKLQEIRFKADTIVYSLDMSPCRVLSDASIQSIINGLADLTDATAMTLTLHADVGARLTEEQKSAASAKNWTLTY